MESNEAKEMFHNPIYAGIGGYPQIIPDETFASAMARNVEEEGASFALKLMREMLEKTFGHALACTSNEDWVTHSMLEISKIGSRQFVLNFLKTLRAELGE